MKHARTLSTAAAAMTLLTVAATLLADVASDMTGPVGPTGFTGSVGPTGPDGAGYTGLGLACGSNGLSLGANGSGVRAVCSTSVNQHLQVLGATNGSAAGLSRVAPVQAGTGTLVATAAGLNNSAVYIENTGPSGFYALSAASAVTGGAVDLQAASVGIPLRALMAISGPNMTSPKTATVFCDTAKERAISGSCDAHASSSPGQATISKRCLINDQGNCAASGEKPVGFSCTGSIGLNFYVAAYVQCLSE